MEEELNKVLNEKTETPYLERFSVLFAACYFIYVIFYYLSFKKNKDFREYFRDNFLMFLLIAFLHVLHILLVKYIYMNGDTKKAWIIMLLPLVLYGIALKIMEKYRLSEMEKYMRFKKMYEAEKKMGEPVDLLAQQENPVYIMPDEGKNIMIQKAQDMMPTTGGQFAPPLPHYQAGSGAAPNQHYSTGMPPQQYMPPANNFGSGGGLTGFQSSDPFNQNFTLF